MKKLGLVFAAAIAALSIGSSASAGYPPAAALLFLSPNPVSVGGSFTATLTGCTVGETVNFTVSGDADSGICTLPAAAGFRRPAVAAGPSATVTMTAPGTPGQYPVVGTGATSGAAATGILTVVAAGPLPATGSDSSSTVQVAGGLVAVGAGLAFVGGLRYRRKHAAAV